MTEVEAGIEMEVEDLGGTEDRVNLKIEIDLTPEIMLGEKVSLSPRARTFQEGVSEAEKGSN